MVARQVIEVVNMDGVGIKWTGHINNIILQASTTAIACFAWKCCVCAASKIFPAGNATIWFFSELDDCTALAACADCLLTTLQPAARLPQAALRHSSGGVACNVLQSWNQCSSIYTINDIRRICLQATPTSERIFTASLLTKTSLVKKGITDKGSVGAISISNIVNIDVHRYSISKLENSSCLQLWCFPEPWCWRPLPLACSAQRSDQLLALTNGPATVDRVKWEQRLWCPSPRIVAAVREKPYYLTIST